jgi:hypothetical protein
VAAQADSGTRSRTDTSDCAKGEVIAKRIPAEPVTMKRKWLSKAMPGSRVVSQTLVRSSGLLFARLKVAGADGSSQNICVNVDSYLSDCGYQLACKSGAKGCDENKGGRRIVRDSPLDHIIVVPR